LKAKGKQSVNMSKLPITKNNESKVVGALVRCRMEVIIINKSKHDARPRIVVTTIVVADKNGEKNKQERPIV
jgi:predicted alpha/beta-hydrolase family hydrolase